MKRLFVTILLIAFATLVYAQYAPTTDKSVKVEADSSSFPYAGIPSFRLPPLQELLENARAASPQVKQFNAARESEEDELKNLQSSWLKWFKLNAAYSYGTNDINNSVVNQTSQTVVYNVSGMTQQWWNVGASLSIPLDDVFTLHRKIDKQKKLVESVQGEMDKWYDEVCSKIIDAYTDAMSNMEILDDATRNLVYARAQYEVAEDDFANGRIQPYDFSVRQKLKLDAVKSYQEVRSALTKDLYQLELLSKTPIFNVSITSTEKK
jgi:outer membrane protein TolC